MLNSAEHEIRHAHNIKMPTTGGILTIIISTINTTPESLKARKVFFFGLLVLCAVEISCYM